MDMNSTVIYDYSDPLSAFAALFILCNGVFGVICNYVIFRNFITNKKERNSFNLICFFRSYTNLHILISIFLAIFLPTTILGYSIYNPAVESSIISFGITLYFVNEYETIVIAVNRFFALYFPVTYSNIFGVKPTLVVILLLNTYQIFLIVQELVTYLPLKCYIFFDVSQLSWSPTLADRCKTYSSNGILKMFGFCFIGVVVCNIINMGKLIHFYMRSSTAQTESRLKIRKNIRLFVQTCFQDFLFVLDVVFTFKLASLSTSRLWTFISGTVIWQCLHSFDGFIMMMFNEKVKLFKRRTEVPVRVVSPTTRTVV